MNDVATYKQTLGRFATGVVVVTAMVEGEAVGFTCQTFGALSLEPPLVFFAATSTGSSWQRLRRAPRVGISILAADQQAVATQFATSGIDKFAGVAYHHGGNGAPLLDGALGYVEGSLGDITTHGDHDLCVVLVEALRAESGEPLLFSQGSFRLLH